MRGRTCPEREVITKLTKGCYPSRGHVTLSVVEVRRVLARAFVFYRVYPERCRRTQDDSTTFTANNRSVGHSEVLEEWGAEKATMFIAQHRTVRVPHR